MKAINFDLLESKHPEYKIAWDALREWFKKNHKKHYIELTKIIPRLQINQNIATTAINLMVDYGMLKTAYKVKSPNGHLLEGEYDSPDKIPNKLIDRDLISNINLANAEIVSGYKW